VCALRRAPAEQIPSSTLGNLSGSFDWIKLLAQVNIVAHLAGRAHVMKETSSDPLQVYRKVNTVGSCRLAEQAVSVGARRFIFVSSIKVNGDSTTGRGPFQATDIAAPEDVYSISKWEAELGLIDISQRTGMELVIVRPPLVYGPGARGNLERLMRLIKLGVPLPFSTISNRRSLNQPGQPV